MNRTRLVLLIEDDAADAKIAKGALLEANANYQIDVATSIRQAFDLMSERKYDVIVSDLSPPDAVGLDAVTEIRLKCDDIPLIVLSRYEEERLYVETLAKGADDFICKDNLTPTNLFRCINQNIERMRQKRENFELVDAVEKQRQVFEKQANQLQQKNARLAALCQSARSFVNNVSHEFRTPLCVIKQYSGMLSQGMFGELAGPQKHFLQVIEDRVDGLNNLVDDMLDISRYESGMLAASRSECSMAEIIRKELPPLIHRGKVRSIKIVADCRDDLPNVFCDSEKVGRTLVNLIVNAIKVSSAGELIQVSVHRDDSKQEVVVRVADHGPGIDEETKQRLCKQFAQGPSSLLCNEKSFGLGLSITKELVSLNLGSLEIESEVGVGSTFVFTIPYANPKAVLSRYLERLEYDAKQQETEVSVLRVSIDRSCKDDSINDVERFLNYALRAHDIAMPIHLNEWLLVLNVVATDMPRFFQRFQDELNEVNRNRPQGELPAINLQKLGSFDRVVQAGEIETCLSRMLAPVCGPRPPRMKKAQYV